MYSIVVCILFLQSCINSISKWYTVVIRAYLALANGKSPVIPYKIMSCAVLEKSNILLLFLSSPQDFQYTVFLSF